MKVLAIWKWRSFSVTLWQILLNTFLQIIITNDWISKMLIGFRFSTTLSFKSEIEKKNNGIAIQ